MQGSSTGGSTAEKLRLILNACCGCWSTHPPRSLVLAGNPRLEKNKKSRVLKSNRFVFKFDLATLWLTIMVIAHNHFGLQRFNVCNVVNNTYLTMSLQDLYANVYKFLSNCYYSNCKEFK